MALFIAVIFLHGWRHPRRNGDLTAACAPGREAASSSSICCRPGADRLVLGTIYGGLATPTESAALGVVAAIGFAAIDRRLSWRC